MHQWLRCTYSQHGLLFPLRLDSDRPQWETLWQHPVLPAWRHSHLTQRSSGYPRAVGWGKVLPRPGPSGALSKHPAGQSHPHWLIFEIWRKDDVVWSSGQLGISRRVLVSYFYVNIIHKVSSQFLWHSTNTHLEISGKMIYCVYNYLWRQFFFLCGLTSGGARHLQPVLSTSSLLGLSIQCRGKVATDCTLDRKW